MASRPAPAAALTAAQAGDGARSSAPVAAPPGAGEGARDDHAECAGEGVPRALRPLPCGGGVAAPPLRAGEPWRRPGAGGT